MDRPDTDLRGALSAAGKVLRAGAALSGLLWWLVVCLSGWLVLFLLDNLLRLPAGLRMPLALAAAGLSIASFLTRVVLPAARRQRAERTALQLERQYGIEGNLVINAAQLERQPLSREERTFAQHTLQDGRRRLAAIPPVALWGATRLRRWGGLAGAAAAVWLLYCLLLPRHAGNAFARFAVPLRDVPPVGAYILEVAPASDCFVAEGDDLAIEAVVRPTRGETAPAETPRLVWAEGATDVAMGQPGSDSVAMVPAATNGRAYAYSFQRIRRAFVFRVAAGDTYSAAVRVGVRPQPRITSSLFRLTPPAYTGREAADHPGPPSAVAGLPGSRLETALGLDRRVSALHWRGPATRAPFEAAATGWVTRTQIDAAGAYSVTAKDPLLQRSVVLAEGELGLEVDQAPLIAFRTEDRNRFVNPGATVTLELEATDDYGIRRIRIQSRQADQATPGALNAAGTAGTGGAPENSGGEAEQDGDGRTSRADGARPHKSWTYRGPPGPTGPVYERYGLELDPSLFVPGAAYVVEALCFDFSPGGVAGRTRPLLLRIKSWADLHVPTEDALAGAFDLLRKATEAQRRANALTANLLVHLAEALQGGTLPGHKKSMRTRQTEAQNLALRASRAFTSHAEGQPYAARLAPLITGEMPWVLRDVDGLQTGGGGTRAEIESVAKRQAYILDELIALLGQVAGQRDPGRPQAGELADEATAPPITAEDAGKQLRDELEDFQREQKRIIDMSRTLMDKGPEDLTEAEEEILGELAREEAEWAKFFEEKLTDFSKLPLQDFADGSLADEFNEVLQEVKLAAKSLYERNVELAVPQEQAGLEKAEELVHNLERWLPDTPDNLKWLMEEPPQQADIPMAELPAELEDIVGELLDKEEAMTEDVEDVTSSWMDSIDKGAGWDAMDGPISSMSAKGVTGNRLPNQQEIGGRSGEGRSGRSHGQMVESAAEGKEGRDTPTRLTPSPFEPGSVEDSSDEETGGATGGGKLSGFTGEGLRGPTPPPRLEEMARLAGQQSAIRQEAEALTLKLRAYNVPSGDLELAIRSMRQFEEAAQATDGLAVRRAFSHVLDALTEARRAVSDAAGLHREHSGLSKWSRGEIMMGLRDGTPKGYEEMVAEYFRALAESGAGAQPGDGAEEAR